MTTYFALGIADIAGLFPAHLEGAAQWQQIHTSESSMQNS